MKCGEQKVERTEKKCPRCGKVLPVNMFNKRGKCLASWCKLCMAEYRAQRYREGKDRHSEESEKKAAVKRSMRRYENGNTYRNEKERKRVIESAKKYQREHKDDENFKEMRKKCMKRHWEKKKMMEEVETLSEFFGDDGGFGFDF